MLTVEANDRYSRVGPGTAAGELMRRYWHPVAPASELEDNPIREVRLLGEDLVGQDIMARRAMNIKTMKIMTMLSFLMLFLI